MQLYLWSLFIKLFKKWIITCQYSVIKEAVANSHMLCCPRYHYRRKISENYYCVLPLFTVLWTIGTIFMILIYQISQNMNHYFPFLDDYNRYRDLKYPLLYRISIEKTNITELILCSSYTHCLVDKCNYIYDHYLYN